MLKQTFSLRKGFFRGQYTLFIYTRRHEKALQADMCLQGFRYGMLVYTSASSSFPIL